jgi:hypothetical protein
MPYWVKRLSRRDSDLNTKDLIVDLMNTQIALGARYLYWGCNFYGESEIFHVVDEIGVSIEEWYWTRHRDGDITYPLNMMLCASRRDETWITTTWTSEPASTCWRWDLEMDEFCWLSGMTERHEIRQQEIPGYAYHVPRRVYPGYDYHVPRMVYVDAIQPIISDQG